MLSTKRQIRSVTRTGIVLLCLFSFFFGVSPSAVASPQVVFWSWLRDDDLHNAPGAVAYLVGRCVVSEQTIKVTPRLNKLILPPKAELYAVVRIETENPSMRTIEPLVSDILALVQRRAPVSGIQIDYDARLRERDFYRALMKTLRQRMPKQLKLSMTALASWCLQDDWLACMPADEVVPMVFSMGADQKRVLNLLKDRRLKVPFGPSCVGLRIDEPLSFQQVIKDADKYERIYLFSSKGWNAGLVKSALSCIRPSLKNQ
jgi:hypothetical protein